MQPGPMPTAGKRRMPRPALISAFRSLRKASKVFALFSAYMDESHDNNRVMCIGGWLAPDRLWEKIEDRWGKRVEHERRISIKKGFPPPSRFHAANCSSLKKEFDRAKGWDVGRQIRFAKVLIGIIGKERLVGYVVGSSLQGYDAHYRSLKAAQRDVYGICMYHCLLLIGQDMELSWPSERVTIFHDHGDFNGAAQSAYTAAKAKDFPYRDFFVTMAPRSWEDCIALQPADLIAYEGFKAIQADIQSDETLVEERMRKSLQAMCAWKIPLRIHYFRPGIFRAVKEWRRTGKLPPDVIRTKSSVTKN
jgi:hypothetical protein